MTGQTRNPLETHYVLPTGLSMRIAVALAALLAGVGGVRGAMVGPQARNVARR